MNAVKLHKSDGKCGENIYRLVVANLNSLTAEFSGEITQIHRFEKSVQIM